ncbi:hypothetical protein KW797_02970, partial [Candidatus Parcubacteria bacterium]|nr:hypothetical protein [Candidatus Parcubacteria bacterium]
EVICSNAWFQLSRTMFQQVAMVYNASCARVQESTTKVVLYSDPTTGASITTGAQIQNVITAATTAGITVAPGTLPSFITVPFETVRELTMADAIRRCLQWTPDAVSWFDYSSGVAVFNCQQRAFLTSTTLDLAEDPPIVEKFTVQKRDDLIPAGVRFNYIGIKSCPPVTPAGCPAPAAGSLIQVSTITQDDAGLVSVPGALIGTVDLAQLTDTTTEAAPTGLAGQYYTSLVTPQYQGSVTTREQECAMTLHPGKLLNLASGHTSWASMNAVVQQVANMLLTGETEITFGPPSHLSPQDFVALIQLTRRRALVANAFVASRPPGTDEEPNCVAGQDPDGLKALNTAKGNAAQMADNINKGSDGLQDNIAGNLSTKTLDVCQDGVADTIQVYAPP